MAAGRDKAWLWAAATRLVTVFTIATSRGAEVAKSILGIRPPEGGHQRSVPHSFRQGKLCLTPIAAQHKGGPVSRRDAAGFARGLPHVHQLQASIAVPAPHAHCSSLEHPELALRNAASLPMRRCHRFS